MTILAREALLRTQPQLVVRPVLMLHQSATVKLPQSQTHRHDAFFPPGAVRSVRVRLPNRWPLKSGDRMPIVSSNSGRFATCLPYILKYEGNYSDHPRDPGGATMRGITLAVYQGWLGRPVTKEQLKAIPDAHLQAIYEDNYFRAAHCHELPAGLDLMIFDLAVNSGVGRARKYLQRAAGVAEDGIIGPATMAAVKARKGLDMVNAVAGYREAFYRGLSTFPTFGKGWLRRLSEVTAKAREMAR